MNKRLQCIAAHVPTGVGLIDVGTDHGYLPVYLAGKGYEGRLIASDIREGPLQAARRTAREAGLSSRIEFQLCDGLEQCDPGSIDSIVIAGMGGDSICGILDRAEWCMDGRYTLILQPMTRAEVLRYWLIYNEFEILSEDLVEDAGTIYAVTLARFGGKTVLKDAELFTGSFGMLRDHPLFGRFLTQQIGRFERMLRGIEQGNGRVPAGRTELIREILTQLQEMKRNVQSE